MQWAPLRVRASYTLLLELRRPWVPPGLTFGLVLLRERVQISTPTMRVQVSGAWNADVAINDTGHTGVTLTTWLKSPRLLSCPRHKEADAFPLSRTSWPRMAATESALGNQACSQFCCMQQKGICWRGTRDSVTTRQVKASPLTRAALCSALFWWFPDSALAHWLPLLSAHSPFLTFLIFSFSPRSSWLIQLMRQCWMWWEISGMTQQLRKLRNQRA